jgi:hypothetical protein
MTHGFNKMGQLHMWPEIGTESVLKISCSPIVSYPGVGQGYSWHVRLLDLHCMIGNACSELEEGVCKGGGYNEDMV